MEDVADQELMARVARGDQRAFGSLSERYARRALALAQRIVRNEALAEEIVQEAFLRLWTHAPRWRPDAPFRSWFYRIVVNLCLNQKRRGSFAPLDAAGDPADPAPDAQAQLEAKEQEQAVARAIDALPERQRAAILLTYAEGLSNVEAANSLGTSLSALETLLVRAKRALRTSLATTDN